MDNAQFNRLLLKGYQTIPWDSNWFSRYFVHFRKKMQNRSTRNYTYFILYKT